MISKPVWTASFVLALAGALILGKGSVAAELSPSVTTHRVELTRPPVVQGLDPLEYRRLRARAMEFARAAQWAEAQSTLELLVNAYPLDGEVWNQLGQARHQLRDYLGAAKAYAAAHDRGLRNYPFRNAANAARSFAQAGDPDAAVRWLRVAIDELRHRDPDGLLQDLAFEAIRSSPQFRAYVAGRQPPPAASREEQWRADIDYFLQEYRRLRTDLSDQRWKDVLVSAEELKGQIADLRDEVILVRLQGLSAQGGRGHNTAPSIYSPTGVRGRALTVLPVDFYLFPDGLYIIGSTSGRDELVGSKVEAIDGVPTDEVIRRIAWFIDRDQGSDMSLLWLAPRYLTHPAFLEAVGAGRGETVSLALRTPAGAARSVNLAGGEWRDRRKLYAPNASSTHAALRPEVPLWLRRVSEPHWFEDLPNRVVYLQFNQVTSNAANNLDNTAQKLHEHLLRTGAQDLIVDLRHNNGGDSYLYLELLRTLVHFDMQPGRRLYVLTSRSTYSAAINFAVDVDRLTNAVFAGEPSSPPNAGGDPVSFTLPYSKAVMAASSVVWALQSPSDTRAWISPSLPVTLTAQDYFGNRDPVLNAVLAAIRAERAGPSQSPQDS